MREASYSSRLAPAPTADRLLPKDAAEERLLLRRRTRASVGGSFAAYRVDGDVAAAVGEFERTGDEGGDWDRDRV